MVHLSLQIRPPCLPSLPLLPQPRYPVSLHQHHFRAYPHRVSAHQVMRSLLCPRHRPSAAYQTCPHQSVHTYPPALPPSHQWHRSRCAKLPFRDWQSRTPLRKACHRRHPTPCLPSPPHPHQKPMATGAQALSRTQSAPSTGMTTRLWDLGSEKALPRGLSGRLCDSQLTLLQLGYRLQGREIQVVGMARVRRSIERLPS